SKYAQVASLAPLVAGLARGAQEVKIQVRGALCRGYSRHNALGLQAPAPVAAQPGPDAALAARRGG
ncbi:MAG: hypothetical protein ACYDB7_07830, partial [Mycobacteriales bacterium]